MLTNLRIGDMLVAAGLVSEAQIGEALAAQKKSGRRLGVELVSLGFVTEVQLTQVLSNQLSIPWVSLYHVEFSRELLNLVPAELADSFCVIPVYARQVRREGVTLFVAMDDPTNEAALDQLRLAAQMPVRPMVAPPSEIRDAIRVYYFGGQRETGSDGYNRDEVKAALAARVPDAVKPVPPPDTGTHPRVSPSAAVTAAARPPAPEPTAVPPPAPVAPTAAAPVTSNEARSQAREPAKPAPGPARPSRMPMARPRMITLTLLDGTTVKLPAPGQGGEEAPKEKTLTARDLVAALLARSQGADVSDVLPDERWEGLFATLLTLLMRKGLIADWEFIDEWQKRQGRS